MKKLGKLTINPEKVIKNNELVNLRGSYGGGGCTVTCYCMDASGYVHLQESFEDCGCTTTNRWITNTCWAQHQPFSYCEPCPV
jgi:hypothetical protein